MHPIDQRLSELGITLPTPSSPVAAYVPCVSAAGLIHVSGQLPFNAEGAMIKGRLGDDLSIEAGADAAKCCAIMILAQVKLHLHNNWSRLGRLVKLGGFVQSTADFFDHPKVINGASTFMLSVLGDHGQHARFALGVPSLPFGVAVEIDAVFSYA